MPEELTQLEIIRNANAAIIEEISKEHDVDYPDRPIMAVLSNLDLAERMATNSVGWGPASAIVIKTADAFDVRLPEELLLPLTGRIYRGVQSD